MSKAAPDFERRIAQQSIQPREALTAHEPRPEHNALPSHAELRRQTRRTCSKSLLIFGTRGIPARYGGFETIAERLALYMVEQGWSVTVYCQRRLEAGLSADGSVVCDTWRGVRLVSIGVWGSGPLSTVLFDWNCIRHARGIDGVGLVLGYNTGIFFPVLVRQGQPVMSNIDGVELQRRE